MKFSKLLVLSALCLCGTGAWAADLIERTAPEQPSATIDLDLLDKTPVTFVAGDCYAMFNVGTEKYFIAGSDYSTRAIVGDNAAVVRFVVTDAAKQKGDGVYELKNYVAKFSEFRSAFYADPNIWTDNNSETNRFWTVTASGSYYQVGNIAETSGNVLGWNGTDSDYRLFMVNPTEQGDNANWQFFAVPEWTNYYKAKDIYDTAAELKKVIEDAESKGVDVTAAVDVYNNENATVEQLNAAAAALKETMNSSIADGTAENPKDATSLLQNPNFDGASNAGWSGTAPNMVGSGSHGPANVAEVYNNTFDTYQILSGMPAGVYALRAYTTFRGSWKDYKNGTPAAAKLYAMTSADEQSVPFINMWSVLNTTPMAGKTYFGTNAAENSQDEDGVTYYSPNDPSAARLYFEKGYYKNMLFFDTDGTAQVGVKNKSKCTDGCDNWSIFDTFSLTYYGNSEASYQKWVDVTIDESFPSYEGVTCTASYLEAFNEMLNNLKTNYTATNRDQAIAAVEAFKALSGDELAAADSLKENVLLWAKYQSVVSEAERMTSDPDYMAFTGDISDYLMIDYEEIMEYKELNNEELNKEIAYVQSMIEEVKKAANDAVKPGDDVTKKYLVNADFASGKSGWTIGKGSCNFSYEIAEAYNSDFDIYQDVQGPMVGVYELQLQGFFRMERDNTALSMYQAGTQKTDAGVYVGTTTSSNKTYLKCVYEEALNQKDENYSSKSNGWWEDTSGEEGAHNWYPNTMESANNAFNTFNMYHNKAYGLVAHEGETMRLGLSGNVTGANWICWDNFKLIYKGYDAEVIKPILQEAMGNIDTSKPMGKSIFGEAEQAVANAQTAINSGDGTQMFNALSAIFELNEKIKTSQNLFADLNTANESLVEAMGSTKAPKAISQEAMTLYATILDGIQNYQYEDEDVEGLTKQITDMKAKMQHYEDLVVANEEMKNAIASSPASDEVKAEATALNAEIENGLNQNPVAIEESAIDGYLQRINALMTKLQLPGDIAEANDLDPKDVTAIIKAPSFEVDAVNSFEGWTGEGYNFGNDATQKGALALEYYNKTFDLYQDIYGLPAGTYEVSCKAFCRVGGIAEDYAAWKADENVSEAYLYANACAEADTLKNNAPVACLFKGAITEDYALAGQSSYIVDAEGNAVSEATEETTTYYFPNDMVSAVSFFELGQYKNTVVVKLAEGQTLRIGIKKDTNSNNGWVLMDDFKMVYYGTDSEKQPSGDNTQGIDENSFNAPVVRIEFFTLDGRKANAQQKGIVIEKQTLQNGAVVIKKIRK